MWEFPDRVTTGLLVTRGPVARATGNVLLALGPLLSADGKGAFSTGMIGMGGAEGRRFVGSAAGVERSARSVGLGSGSKNIWGAMLRSVAKNLAASFPSVSGSLGCSFFW
jgi:hypothetical protein